MGEKKSDGARGNGWYHEVEIHTERLFALGILYYYILQRCCFLLPRSSFVVARHTLCGKSSSYAWSMSCILGEMGGFRPMPFALMEIFPRFGWTKSPNAARGERAAGAFVCSFFIIRSSLLLDLPVPPRFANAFAPVVLMREMTDFPPLPPSPAGGLFFSMAKPAVFTPTYALSSVAAFDFVLDEAILSSSSDRSGSSSELDAYSLSYGINIGSMLLPPVPTLPM